MCHPIGEIIQYWAVGTIVAMALLDEISQGHLHRLKFGNFAFDIANATDRQCPHLGASSTAITIEIEQLSARLDGEAQ